MIDSKHIEEMWGPRCDQYEAGCGCCDMWQMWDEIERLRAERDRLAAAVRAALAAGTAPPTTPATP